MKHYDTIVIGAGVSGIICARSLAISGRSTLILEKEDKVGGRLATLRIRNAVFDYGAQFFTARSGAFMALVEQMLKAGAVRQWFRGASGNPRYCGTEGMEAIAHYLIREIDHLLSIRVDSVVAEASGWRAVTNCGEYTAETMVITAPLPQAFVPLENSKVLFDPERESDLASVRYDPCLALLGESSQHVNISEYGAAANLTSKVAWAADNRVKGISPIPTYTIHFSPEFSAAWFDAEETRVIDAARRDLSAIGHPLAGVIDGNCTVKRWRYARVVKTAAFQAMGSARYPGLVLSGDAFGGARVEGAAESGLKAAAIVESFF